MSAEDIKISAEEERLTAPTQLPPRRKNPKKVAAGKALAEANRKARNALAREPIVVNDDKASVPWGLLIGIAGLGIGIYSLFLQRQTITRRSSPTPIADSSEKTLKTLME